LHSISAAMQFNILILGTQASLSNTESTENRITSYFANVSPAISKSLLPWVRHSQ